MKMYKIPTGHAVRQRSWLTRWFARAGQNMHNMISFAGVGGAGLLFQGPCSWQLILCIHDSGQNGKAIYLKRKKSSNAL